MIHRRYADGKRRRHKPEIGIIDEPVQIIVEASGFKPGGSTRAARAGTCNQSYGPYESAWDGQALFLVFCATSKCGYRQSLYKDSSRIPTLHCVVRPVRSLSAGF